MRIVKVAGKPARNVLLWQGVMTALILTLFIWPNLVSGEVIVNQLTAGPPYDIVYSNVDWTHDSGPFNQHNSAEFSSASTSGMANLYMETHARALIPNLNNLEHLVGEIRLGHAGLECVRPGSYSISAQSTLNGMAGIYITQTGGAWEALVNVRAVLEVYDPYNALIMTKVDTLFHHSWTLANHPPETKDSTAQYFDNYPLNLTIDDINLSSAGNYQCVFSIKAEILANANYAWGVWGIVQLFPGIFTPIGPWQPSSSGGVVLNSITITDLAPDYAPPVTTAYTEPSPCGAMLALQADDGDGYGVAGTYYNAPMTFQGWQEYTGPVEIHYPGNTWFYSVDRAGNKEERKPIYIILMPPNMWCTPGTGLIDLGWEFNKPVRQFNIYRDGILIDSTTNMSWRDTNPGTEQRCYNIIAINTCEDSISATEWCCQAEAPPTPPYVKIVDGSLNGTPMAVEMPEISVESGQNLSGEIILEALNTSGPVNAAPLVGVWGWGNHETSYMTVVSQIPEGTSTHQTAISLQAPAAPGEYYLSFAYSLEIGEEHVASLTNWQVDDAIGHWNDGHDMADWGATEYQQACSEHIVTTLYRGPGGWSNASLPAAMIKVVVTAPAPVPYVKLADGALNGVPVAVELPEISVGAGQNLSGEIFLEDLQSQWSGEYCASGRGLGMGQS